MMRLALCDKLKMTLTQLKNNATKDDIIMHAAFYEIQADMIPDPPTPSARPPRRR
jgi:hypothetical protein